MTNKFCSYKVLAALFIVVSALLSSPVYSQSIDEFGVLINLSGKQRMLTQKMSKEAMLIALNVNPEENSANLKKTASLFDQTLKGLVKGDKSLGLVPTRSKRTLRQLKRVTRLWDEFYPNIQAIAESQKATEEQITFIAQNNLMLLRECNKAVGAYEKDAEKSGMESLPGLAVSLNLSGKQRMLTQKMSKELLLVAYGIDTETNRLRLLETYTLFERTLIGLKQGDNILNLPATTDPNILAQLDAVDTLWSDARSAFEDASHVNAIVSARQIDTVARLNLPLLKEMNKAVGMYASLAN